MKRLFHSILHYFGFNSVQFIYKEDGDYVRCLVCGEEEPFNLHYEWLKNSYYGTKKSSTQRQGD